jgi:hypothetical protein
MAAMHTLGVLRVATISALATLAASATLLRAQTETVIQVPSGTYDFSQILKQSGTSSNWIRYRPAVPGGVTIRGGEFRNIQYVILDGFTVDGRLDPEWPGKSRGIDVRTSHHVTVMNTEVIGPADIHTGFDISGKSSCREADGFPNVSGGIGARDDTEAITFSNVVVHGFYAAGAFRGKRDRIVNSLFRNNYNGLSVSSVDIAIVDSVFWVHPNHLFSIQGAGRIFLVNNLLVDAQDMFQTGSGREGAEDVSILHNTFWIPANKPCYGFSGLNLYAVSRRGHVTNNVIVNKQEGFIAVSDASVATIASDYNLFFTYVPTTKEFNFIDRKLMVPIETWRSMTAQDSHSLARQAPQFVNEPQYEDYTANQWGFRIPPSVSEARRWLSLKAGSPGKNSASDELDRGFDSRFDSRQIINSPPTPAALHIRR